MSDTVSFPVDHPCSGATPVAADHSRSSTVTDVPGDDKSRADGRESDQAYGNAIRMAAGEPELRRFQMPAVRISDGSHCVVLVIERTSSWSIYGADRDGVHVSDNSMTVLAGLVLKRNEAGSTGVEEPADSTYR